MSNQCQRNKKKLHEKQQRENLLWNQKKTVKFFFFFYWLRYRIRKGGKLLWCRQIECWFFVNSEEKKKLRNQSKRRALYPEGIFIHSSCKRFVLQDVFLCSSLWLTRFSISYLHNLVLFNNELNFFFFLWIGRCFLSVVDCVTRKI